MKKMKVMEADRLTVAGAGKMGVLLSAAAVVLTMVEAEVVEAHWKEAEEEEGGRLMAAAAEGV